jgi:dinuclear metal center YbgI/SA1388 family protein
MKRQVTVDDIVSLLEEMAPPHLAESWDNVGLMLGRRTQPVHRVLLALDMTQETVDQAINGKADLLVTHHPAIFKPLGRVTSDDWQQELLLQLAEHGIAVFSAHTNLDCVSGGVNDCLVKCLGITDEDVLDAESGLGRIGYVPEQALESFAVFVKQALNADYVAVGDAGRTVRKVAVCGGAGSDFIAEALRQHADTLVTGDVKYHDAQRAVFGGLNIIDAGHQATELPVLEKQADRLSLRFTEKNWNVNLRVAKEALLLKHF